MADIPRNRTLLYIAAIGAALVVAGYATFDQWVSWLPSLAGLLG